MGFSPRARACPRTNAGAVRQLAEVVVSPQHATTEPIRTPSTTVRGVRPGGALPGHGVPRGSELCGRRAVLLQRGR